MLLPFVALHLGKTAQLSFNCINMPLAFQLFLHNSKVIQNVLVYKMAASVLFNNAVQFLSMRIFKDFKVLMVF